MTQGQHQHPGSAPRQVEKWYAPTGGGYRGLGPDGQVVRRPSSPPKVPATAEGVRRMQRERRAAGT
jgi:hypothetical protein